jgi:hypothetical protein
MTDAPFQDLLPSPEIVHGGTALALKGKYYLVRVKSPYTRPDECTEIDLSGEGPYKVELIDPWLMKIFDLGYTRGGLQTFQTMVTPSLFRLTKATGVDPKMVSDNIQSLLGRWIDDPGGMKPPAPIPLKILPEYYSPEFTVGELLDDPRTKALLDKYLPDLPQKGFVRVFTLEQLATYRSMENREADIYALGEALRKIPVQREE